ncbi:MAG: glycosyltransferase [Thermoplasmatales archaeon]|nr:glycosyltransferase [Thermoplasmatales archaeon]
MSKTVLMPIVMKIEYDTRVLQEANSLKRAGYQVKIVGFSNIRKERRFKVNNIDVISFYLHDARAGLGKIYRYCTAFKMLLGINYVVFITKADIYHAHNFHVLPACFFSALIHNGKVVYETHETWIVHKKQKYHPEHIFAYVIEKLFLGFSDAFITINEMIAAFYEEKYGVSRAIVFNNYRPLIPNLPKNTIREELKIKANTIAIFVGGFWPTGRGIFELIRSVQYLDNDVIIVLLGYGSENMIERMNNQIKSVRCENKVYILPPKPLDKVMGYIMSADIGMNLIKRENRAQDFQSPCKLFEYCMGGLAVISTDLPFHRKIHKKYSIGPLVGQENKPFEIAKAINELTEHKEKLLNYKRNARFAAEHEFNWENAEVKLLSLYDSLK